MTRDAQPREVVVYTDEDGNVPFSQWLNGLPNAEHRQRILIRIGRVEQGNLGDCKPVGEGVSELVMAFGPGYRVYFGQEGTKIVILLCGGDKSTQKRDIKTAKSYWKEYNTDAQT